MYGITIATTHYIRVLSKLLLFEGATVNSGQTSAKCKSPRSPALCRCPPSHEARVGFLPYKVSRICKTARHHAFKCAKEGSTKTGLAKGHQISFLEGFSCSMKRDYFSVMPFKIPDFRQNGQIIKKDAWSEAIVDSAFDSMALVCVKVC